MSDSRWPYLDPDEQESSPVSPPESPTPTSFPVSRGACDYQSITNREAAMTTGPRTYQSAWQWNDDKTAKLLTAEEWLEEEADVDEAISRRPEGPTPPMVEALLKKLGIKPRVADDLDDDGPNRGGILRAIAKELATLRAERTYWAEECTRRTATPQSERTNPS